MPVGASIDTFHSSLPGAFSKPPLPPGWESDWTTETVSEPGRPGLSAVEQFIAEESPVAEGSSTVEGSPVAEESPIVDGREEDQPPSTSPGGAGEGRAGEGRAKAVEIGALPGAPEFEPGFPGCPIPDPSSPRPPADAYAFYLPFHLFRTRGWGIFLIGKRVRDLCEDFFQEARPDLTIKECKIATRLYLYEHEHFHHKVESFSSRQEASHRESIYLQGQRQLYEQMQGTDNQLEEALAEAHALIQVEKRLRRREWPEPKREAFLGVLKGFMKRSGPGYRRGPSIYEKDRSKETRSKENQFEENRFEKNRFEKNRFDEVRNEFAERILSTSPAPQRYRGPEIWAIANDLFRGIASANSDFRYIVPAGEPISSPAELSG